MDIGAMVVPNVKKLITTMVRELVWAGIGILMV
jgi:hypothetical protein